MPLADTQIRNAKPTERQFKLSDGGWLFLVVTPSGSKLWRMAYRFSGIEKTLSFGGSTSGGSQARTRTQGRNNSPWKPVRAHAGLKRP